MSEYYALTDNQNFESTHLQRLVGPSRAAAKDPMTAEFHPLADRVQTPVRAFVGVVEA